MKKNTKLKTSYEKNDVEKNAKNNFDYKSNEWIIYEWFKIQNQNWTIQQSWINDLIIWKIWKMMKKICQQIITEIFNKKEIMWEFDILYLFDLSQLVFYMMINQNNDCEFDCFCYGITLL